MKNHSCAIRLKNFFQSIKTKACIRDYFGGGTSDKLFSHPLFYNGCGNGFASVMFWNQKGTSGEKKQQNKLIKMYVHTTIISPQVWKPSYRHATDIFHHLNEVGGITYDYFYISI